MKRIILISILCIGSLCLAMEDEDSYASAQGQDPSDDRKSSSSSSFLQVSDEVQSWDNQGSMDYGSMISTPEKGAYVKYAMPSSSGSLKYYTAVDGEYVEYEGEAEFFLIPEEREIVDYADIKDLEDPLEIAQYCNNLANNFALINCKDVLKKKRMERSAEQLALKNLIVQQELAYEEYSYSTRVTELVEKLAELTRIMEETRMKVFGHQDEVSKCENCDTPQAFTILEAKENHNTTIKKLTKKLKKIEKEITVFTLEKSESEFELQKLEVKTLKLSQSLIRLRQTFKVHISKAAAIQAVRKVKEIQKKPKKFNDCNIQ